MTFAWPLLLWLLALPAALLAWELARRRRSPDAVRPRILQGRAGGSEVRLDTAAVPSRRAGPRIWLCAGLAAAVVALARPQWGRLEEPVFDQAREIILAIDLSRSMQTPDVKPSRLGRAKLLVQSLLENLAGERVGLVVFAGTAFLQSPLSADYEILREFLPALTPDFLPQGGTNYRALLDTSLDAFSGTSAADRFLVVLSDGEATEDDWREQLDALRKKGIRVIGLGLGTAGGAMIPDGAGGFVKDERGAVVLSKLESATLQELARETQGAYRDASTWIDLAALVRETVARGRQGEFVETNTVRLVERFQWPLALGVWCLLVSFWYEFPVRPRVREMRLAGGGTGAGAAGIALLLAALGSIWPARLEGAATLANPAKPEPREEATDLSKLVGRLAAASGPTARDWADLGRETVTWGSRLQSQQQPVPEGPVRDALEAAARGSRLDPKATDWTKLREELEALLQKPEEQKKPDEPKPDQPQQQDQKQDQDQKQSDSQPKDQPDQKQKNDQTQKQQDPKQDSPSKADPDRGEQQDPGQPSAGQPPPTEDQGLGDMKKQEPPPPPPSETRKVGGAPERKEAAEPADPSLALPLQKLDQIRNQDSPAELFQLLRRDRLPPKKNAKDW